MTTIAHRTESVAVDRAAERSFRGLFAVSVLVPALLFVSAAVYDYRLETESATQHVVTTADAFAEHADAVLKTNQLVLALTVDRLRDLDWEQIRSDRSVHEFLERLTGRLPQLQSVFVVDPQGRIAASSRAFPMVPFDVTNRDYFQAARDGITDLFISAPFKGMAAGTFAFTVTRPRDPARGIAGGLVGLTLSPSYFERFYRTVTPSGDRAVTMLVRNDGAVLVRTPEYTDTEPHRLAPGGQIDRAMAGGAASGLFRGRPPAGNNPRTGAFRRLGGFPVFVTYSEDVGETLADWYRHMGVLASFALLTMAVLLYSSAAALQRSRRERASLRLLLAETRRREEAEETLRRVQKIEALGRLTGGVAHDFNNLLTAVIGSLELALRRTTEPRIHPLLQGAMDAARRGARLTQQMLAFARQQNVQLTSLSVNATLRGTDELLSRTIGPEIRIRYEMADDLWPALGDATQLEVAMLNLAINARDAMPDGGTLLIRTTNLPAGAPRSPDVPAGDFVVVAVADTGTGMPEEVRGRAVEPFFTTKEIGRGTGLGLSMVDGFARQAGGALAIESQTGRGTTIRIYLPRGPQPVAPAVDEEAGRAHAPLRVLLIDDDDQVRASTREMLEELGHAVIDTGDGMAGLALAEAEPRPQLMMVDYAMPVLNGSEVTRLVLQRRPDLPVLFLTGYAEVNALREWTARGYVTLPKPFTLAALSDAVAATARRPIPAVAAPPQAAAD